MKKTKLLPRLALRGVVQNGTVYFPYLVACIFSVFTLFIFSSILKNDIMETLPHSAYAWMLLTIGKVLLQIILLPFLFYANSFLIKRRKKEIGLYSLLGLEKKHTGIMLLLENVILYVCALTGGIILGMVLAKLLFLILLKLSGLPVVAQFVFSVGAFQETIIFFGIVFLINYICSLIQLGKSKPVELLSGSKKGEKEPKGIAIYAMLGVIALGFGYKMAICAKLNSMIFIDFFLAVFLVVVGSYLLFTSGSVFFLKLLQKNNKIYYKPSNFITISGMLYRMKKSAAGLSNICIFSTMVLITLTCTLALFLGKEDIAQFDYPYDTKLFFDEKVPNQQLVEEKIAFLENKYGIQCTRMDNYDSILVTCGFKRGENTFSKKFGQQNQQDNYSVVFLTLEDYNQMEGTKETLEEDEVYIYSSGANFNFDTVRFMGIEAKVKKEIYEMYPWPKAEKNIFQTKYVIIVKDRATRDKYVNTWAKLSGVEDIQAQVNSGNHVTALVLNGVKGDREKFVEELSVWAQLQPGFTLFENGISERERVISMEGGLLFIGIIFGLIFFMCLLLIMYFKQISEGYEDQSSFAIMQKVGLSDKEIRQTVRKQILMVFFIPLGASLLHTTAGMFMVDCLMGAVRFFNTPMIIQCCIAVSIFFLFIYGISYLMTARTYYKIVHG